MKILYFHEFNIDVRSSSKETLSTSSVFPRTNRKSSIIITANVSVSNEKNLYGSFVMDD